MDKRKKTTEPEKEDSGRRQVHDFVSIVNVSKIIQDIRETESSSKYVVVEHEFVDEDIRQIFNSDALEHWPNFLPSILQLNRTLKDISNTLKLIAKKV